MYWYWIWIAIIVVAVAVLVVVWAKSYRKVGPNQVLVISGRTSTVTGLDGRIKKVGYRLQVGGGTLVVPFLETVDVLPLEVFSLSIKCPEVLTAQGVLITAEAQGQIKICSDEPLLHRAVENFLSKGASGITYVAQEVLEGHARGILGTMSVEEVYEQREHFSELVREAAAEDYSRLGLELVSFSLKDISDTQDYIASVGSRRIAEVRRDAVIAKAETERDASIRSAEYRKEGDVAKLKAEAELARATRDFEVQRAEYQMAVNVKRAGADVAYDIERAKLSRELKEQEYNVRITEKKMAAKVEEAEVARREMELEATVRRPAEAMKDQAKLEAESEAYRLELQAKGKAAGIKLAGQAEASAMRDKAEAWHEYGDAAFREMAIKGLPELARAVSEPLSKVDKIIMVGNGDGVSRLTGQVASILAQLPEIVENLSGIKLQNLVGGAGKSKEEEKNPKADKT